jgi:hypothetical protein
MVDRPRGSAGPSTVVKENLIEAEETLDVAEILMADRLPIRGGPSAPA